MTMADLDLDRRALVKSAAWSSLALVLPFALPEAEAKPLARLGVSSNAFAPNAFLSIEPDDSITVYAKHLEMGQGVYTGLATILADELGADWGKIKVASAPADAKLYNNLFWGTVQGTGGSSSIANSWKQLRVAGAQARTMLLAAAAQSWGVPASELAAESGSILHPPSGRKQSFGSLAAAARLQTPPQDPVLKTRDQYQLIGKPRSLRIDGAAKTKGQAQFAMDVREPGQIVALVARPPRPGARLKSVDATAAKAIKGVLEVVEIPQGVAVLAESFWPAKKGREALVLTWDDSQAFKGSSDDLAKEYRALLGKSGLVAVKHGDWQEQSKQAAQKLEASFVFPYLAHAPMEPLNCVIKLGPQGCEIWAGSQSQTGDQGRAAAILELEPQQVTIHTMLAGGSFGRRANPTSDYISEAAAIAKATRLRNRPIHLMWTREDDLRGGYYRPLTMHRVAAGLDKQGKALFWHQRLACQSILKAAGMQPKDGLDPTSLEGASDLAYAIPHRQCELHSPEGPVTVLWWRSVGHTHTAFVAESVVDELAALAGKDPVAFRLDLLTERPRHQAVLKKAAEMAGWGRKLPAGTGLGVAVHGSFGSVVAEVAQVKVENGSYRVEKVWCAVDCGIAVNPDIVKAQMEGGIGYGLSALLREQIVIREGQVTASNFHDYAPLRMSEMPEVEVAIMPSDADPSGVGEPGLPPLAPAVANAIAAVTGKRLRELPLRLEA
jgi:isoquinoline 1-oxidoreductase beta subunit